MMNHNLLRKYPRLSPSRLVLALGGLLAVASGCGPDKGTYVVVKPTGKVTTELRVEATLDGKSFGQAQDFSGLNNSLVLQLPVETKGRFRVDVKSYDGDSCAASMGNSEVSLEGQDLYNVSVDLQTPKLAPCQVTGSRILRIVGYNRNDVWAVGESATMMHWDGKSWTHFPQEGLFNGNFIAGVWGLSGGDILFVGGTGQIVRRIGGINTLLSSGVSEGLNGITGDKDGTEVWIVGDNGTILRRESTGWSSKPLGGNDWFPASRPELKKDKHLFDIARLFNGSFYAVGMNGLVLRKDPGSSTWIQQDVGTDVNLYRIIATSTDAWIVGDKNTVLRWVNGSWTKQILLTQYNGALISIAEIAPNVLLLGGARGTVLRCDHSVYPLTCTQWSADTISNLWSIWSDKSSVSFVGGAPPNPSGGVSSATVFRFQQ